MLNYFDQLVPWFADMTDLGGMMFIWILLVAFFIWCMAVERLLYVKLTYPGELKQSISHWHTLSFQNNWIEQQELKRLLSQLRYRLNKRISLIKVLIAICPLLGLLGTVFGMLEVFDGMAATGSNNAKSTAAGVSKATVSTMAGMVVAISGLFLMTFVERFLNQALQELSTSINKQK